MQYSSGSRRVLEKTWQSFTASVHAFLIRDNFSTCFPIPYIAGVFGRGKFFHTPLQLFMYFRNYSRAEFSCNTASSTKNEPFCTELSVRADLCTHWPDMEAKSSHSWKGCVWGHHIYSAVWEAAVGDEHVVSYQYIYLRVNFSWTIVDRTTTKINPSRKK